MNSGLVKIVRIHQGGSSGFKKRPSFEMPDCRNAEEKSSGRREIQIFEHYCGSAAAAASTPSSGTTSTKEYDVVIH